MLVPFLDFNHVNFFSLNFIFGMTVFGNIVEFATSIAFFLRAEASGGCLVGFFLLSRKCFCLMKSNSMGFFRSWIGQLL